MFGEGTSDSTGLLGAQVQRLVLLVFVELSQVGTLCLVDDCQHFSDGLSHNFSKKNG